MKTIKVKDFMAISGKSGLFRYLAQARSGVIVESLEDKKRAVVPPTARVSALEDISIFCETEDVPIADVFYLIYEKEEGKEAIDPKSDISEIKAYLSEVLPEYDEERVYTSDIKKLLTWYNTLQKLELLEVIEKEEEDEEKADAEAPKEEETKKDKEE
ncbi:DUF5606 domain-containing protein [Bacteroidota bacterium]